MNENKDFLNEKIEVLTNLYAVFRDERDVFEKNIQQELFNLKNKIENIQLQLSEHGLPDINLYQSILNELSKFKVLKEMFFAIKIFLESKFETACKIIFS